MNDLFEEIQAVLESGVEEYEKRVDGQIAFLMREHEEGVLHNPEPTVGLELELYCVDGDGRLARLDQDLLEEMGIAKELGLHNAEVNTEYTLFDENGLRAQMAELVERLERAREVLSGHDLRLVSDGMWVIPPAEGSMEYLDATVEHEGLVIAENAAPLPRYHTISNVVRNRAGGAIPLKVPGFEGSFRTILPESLTTSIQPHHQVPDPDEFPTYFNYSIRLLGPVLALATNSPFLPADMYGEDFDPGEVAYHELRIQLFEQMINTEEDCGERKVRVPHDLKDVHELFEKIKDDETVVPVLAEEPGGRYEDRFFEFNLKRGTFWRWTRPVVGGETRQEANLRIEFRPLPSQPTLKDTVGLQALFSGLLMGLYAEEHPLLEQEWEVAKDNFYRAAEEGIHAELEWIDASGDTVDNETMFEEIFDLAERGLEGRGISESFLDEYIEPLRLRAETGITPSFWKLERAEEYAGELGPREALIEAQRDYLDMQERHLFTGTFADFFRKDI